jgi:hypothetical protein
LEARLRQRNCQVAPAELGVDPVLASGLPGKSNPSARTDDCFTRDPIRRPTVVNLAEFTETVLGDTSGRQIWRVLMATRTYPFVSQLRLQGREEGRAALAKAIFKVFDRRGIEVDKASRTRIESCGDTDVLNAWLDRSFEVATVGELFV